MRTHSQAFSTLLIALCLQACVGGNVEPTKLGAKKPRSPESVGCPEFATQDFNTEALEVPWHGEEESIQHTAVYFNRIDPSFQFY